MFNIENTAFMCFAQATEGDFTVGQEKLNQAAAILIYNWNHYRENPNDPSNYYAACRQAGFDYDVLLDEEVDYLASQIRSGINAI